MSKVIGWSVINCPAGFPVRPFFEFDERQESVFAKISSAYADLVACEKAPQKPDEDFFLRLGAEICARYSLSFGKSSLEKVAQAAHHSICGYGCLDFLLCRGDLEEISFVSPDKPIFVFSRTQGAWLDTNCYLRSERFATSLVNRMARQSGQRLSFATPRVDAQIPSGARLHASCPPVSPGGVSFSIRLFPQSKMTISSLVSRGTLSGRAAAFLWFAMQADCSLLVAGNTGGGKTTLLGGLSDFIGLSERIVLVEDTPELTPLHEHVARLVASKTPMAELVKDTLRMRPDRVFVGEVRCAPDARALFDCLLSGQARGTYSTFHSDSASEALSRLRLMGASEHDLAGLDLIVVCRRIPRYDISSKKGFEVRRVTEICEVVLEGGNAQARPLFSYEDSTDSLRFCGFGRESHPACDKIFSCLCGVGLGEFESEWARRERFILSHEGTELGRAADCYLYSQRAGR